MGAQRTVCPHAVAQPRPGPAWRLSRPQPFHNQFCNNTEPLSQHSGQLGTNLVWPRLCQVITRTLRRIHEDSSNLAQEAAAATPATHPADVRDVHQALNCHTLHFCFFSSNFHVSLLSHANYKGANFFKILKVYPL